MSDKNDSPENDVLKGLLAFGVMVIKVQFFNRKVLRRVVKQGRAQLVNDYSGGSLVSQRSQTLFLYGDDTFRLEDRVFRSITGGGISLPSEEVTRISGSWSLDMSEDSLYLALNSNDGTSIRWTVEEREKEVFYVDGQRWKVEEM